MISIIQPEPDHEDEKLSNQQKTFLEKRGGHPTYMLNGNSDSSERSGRKKVMSDAFRAKSAARKRKN